MYVLGNKAGREEPFTFSQTETPDFRCGTIVFGVSPARFCSYFCLIFPYYVPVPGNGNVYSVSLYVGTM